MNKKILLMVVCIVCASSFVYAYCSSPSEPFGSVPTPPFCADTFGGVGECDQWEIDGYRDEIEDYIDKWRRYAEEAVEAAQCEQEEAIEAWNNFAR